MKKNVSKSITKEPLTDNGMMLPNIPSESQHSEYDHDQQLYMLAKKGLSEYADNSCLPLPEQVPSEFSLVNVTKEEVIYNCVLTDTGTYKVFYITDMHLEHQLGKKADFHNKTKVETIRYFKSTIKRKIHEMLAGIAVSKNDILLVGGDVADSVGLTELFYQELCKQWYGEWIIAILGNHELWDNFYSSDYHPRALNAIISDYRHTIEHSRSYDHSSATIRFLENQVWFRDKNGWASYHTEKYLLEASDDELTHNLSECTQIILGGIGFSGLNPKYNAENGFYRATISTQEKDQELSLRFRTIHDKLKRCVPQKRVIVLTHTPINNWTTEAPQNNWIYVNGHTHHNSIRIEKDGPTIFSDNQIGYSPRKWTLHSFIIDHLWYDPFEGYEDGIYEITSEQYYSFNRGRGIRYTGCNYPGTIYVLKRNVYYMFVLKNNRSLCLLSGGRRKKLKSDNIHFYYENLEQYILSVKQIVKPYEETLETISLEVKSFGGWGTIHGCIVDISFNSHIYVNPIDGTLRPYWAETISSREAYPNLSMLLKNRESDLFSKYKLVLKEHTLSLLAQQLGKKLPQQVDQAILPEWLTGTDIYKPSYKMMEIQYAWEKNVIRTWQEHIVCKDDQLPNTLPVHKSTSIQEETSTQNNQSTDEETYLQDNKSYNTETPLPIDENHRLGNWQALTEIKKFEEFRRSSI